MNCVFCEMCEEPHKIIFENKDFFVIKDHLPKAKIHLLLMPKKHIDNISELNKKSLDFLKEMKKIGSNLLTKLGCEKDSQVIGFHTPDYISVHHLHLHLLCKPFKNNSESKYLSHPEFAKLDKLIKYFT